MTSPATRQTGVRVTGLSKAFDRRPILHELTVAITPGEFVALLGKSGSGKSTLLKILARLDTEVDAAELLIPQRVAVSFQEPRLLPWSRVWRNVVLGLNLAEPKERAEAALAEVDLADRANAWPLTLSGGEAQRVSLARALVREPELLLLDEPFGALDALTRLSMHQLVLDLWIRHTPSVLLVTHDVDEALLLADRVLVLAGGQLVGDLPVPGQRPRRATTPGLADARAQVMGLLGIIQ